MSLASDSQRPGPVLEGYIYSMYFVPLPLRVSLSFSFFVDTFAQVINLLSHSLSCYVLGAHVIERRNISLSKEANCPLRAFTLHLHFPIPRLSLAHLYVRFCCLSHASGPVRTEAQTWTGLL